MVARIFEKVKIFVKTEVLNIENIDIILVVLFGIIFGSAIGWFIFLK